MKLKEIARWLLPPIALVAARGLRKGLHAPRHLPEWDYVADQWPESDPREAGWLHDSVVTAQETKWPEFERRLRGPGPLGIAHEAPTLTSHDCSAHNTIMSFAYALARAAHRREALSVLDWGGGIGHYALIARAVMPELAFDYVVHDLPALCAAGQRLLPDVRFSADPEPIFARSYDLVFISASLHYARRWQELLGRLAGAAESWLYLTRLPTVATAPNYVIAQRPTVHGYQTEYISWVLNRAELIAKAQTCGLSLDREFLIDERPTVAGAPEQCEYRGFLFRSAGI